MAALLVLAVVASMAGLILPPLMKIMRLDRKARMELKPFGPAFAPE
jgi:hypothetical protein